MRFNTNMQNAGFVDDNVTIRGIGVNTPTSTTKYAIRLGQRILLHL